MRKYFKFIKFSSKLGLVKQPYTLISGLSVFNDDIARFERIYLVDILARYERIYLVDNLTRFGTFNLVDYLARFEIF